MIQIIGWLASICFAMCAAPQAILSYRQGHSKGISKTFLFLWLMGELLMMIYVPLSLGWDGPIMVNLIVNTAFILVILKYMYFPRRKNESIKE